MKIAIALIALLALTACSNKEGAKRALFAEGFTNVQLVGIEWGGCMAHKHADYPSAFPMSQVDLFPAKFTAINPDGKAVQGTVCSGRFIKENK